MGKVIAIILAILTVVLTPIIYLKAATYPVYILICDVRFEKKTQNIMGPTYFSMKKGEIIIYNGHSFTTKNKLNEKTKIRMSDDKRKFLERYGRVSKYNYWFNYDTVENYIKVY